MVKKKDTRAAKEAIVELFEAAKKAGNQEDANRYVELARNVAMKHRIHIPAEFKRLFCNHCYIFLKHGENVRVRLNNSKLTYFCSNCNKYWRRRLK